MAHLLHIDSSVQGEVGQPPADRPRRRSLARRSSRRHRDLPRPRADPIPHFTPRPVRR